MRGISRRAVAVAVIGTLVAGSGASIAGAATNHHTSGKTAPVIRSAGKTAAGAGTTRPKRGKPTTSSKSGRDETESRAMKARERREEARESASKRKAKLRHEPRVDASA
jgi:hypothetical protein